MGALIARPSFFALSHRSSPAGWMPADPGSSIALATAHYVLVQAQEQGECSALRRLPSADFLCYFQGPVSPHLVLPPTAFPPPPLTCGSHNCMSHREVRALKEIDDFASSQTPKYISSPRDLYPVGIAYVTNLHGVFPVNKSMF